MQELAEFPQLTEIKPSGHLHTMATRKSNFISRTRIPAERQIYR